MLLFLTAEIHFLTIFVFVADDGAFRSVMQKIFLFSSPGSIKGFGISDRQFSGTFQSFVKNRMKKMNPFVCIRLIHTGLRCRSFLSHSLFQIYENEQRLSSAPGRWEFLYSVCLRFTRVFPVSVFVFSSSSNRVLKCGGRLSDSLTVQPVIAGNCFGFSDNCLLKFLYINHMLFKYQIIILFCMLK